MSGRTRFSAKTVADALTEASISFGVTSDHVGYEIIEKGSEGFLGIGRKQAVIEAWVKKEEAAPEEKIEIKKEEKPAVKPAVKSAEPAEEPVKEVKVQRQEKNENPRNQEYNREKKDFKKNNRNNKNRRDRFQKESAKESVKEAVKEPVKEAAEEVFEEKKIEVADVTDETKAAVMAFLHDTLAAMDLEVELEASIDADKSLCIEMKGDKMGILIGKRGQTLDSLQYLCNRVANKHQTGYVRVKLDTENYRGRREETLKHLAKSKAHAVKKNRRPFAFEPMNPYERRIIHSALQSDPYVTTHSEGEEPYRKVVITLKNKRR